MWVAPVGWRRHRCHRVPPQCESIAEEYEDELIEFLSHEAENVKDRLCSKRTGEPGGLGGSAAAPLVLGWD